MRLHRGSTLKGGQDALSNCTDGVVDRNVVDGRPQRLGPRLGSDLRRRRNRDRGRSRKLVESGKGQFLNIASNCGLSAATVISVVTEAR